MRFNIATHHDEPNVKNRSPLRKKSTGILPLAFALSACGTEEEQNLTGLTLIGTDDDDTLSGESKNDTISGGNGADIIHGRGGNDVLNGDAGDDFVYGDAGDDTIINGSGFDPNYTGGGGVDYYDGGDGNDTLVSGIINRTSTIIFTEEINLITGIVGAKGSEIGRDKILNIENVTYVGDLNIEITGNDLDNVLNGGSGDDIIIGGAGNDTIYGGKGTDTVYGNDGDDLIIHNWNTVNADGGSGSDTFYVRIDSEYMSESGLTDRAFGLEMNFQNGTFRAFNETTNEFFNTGDDNVSNIENFKFSGNFNVTVIGDDNGNNIETDMGDDNITAGSGNDIVNAGGGNDTIYNYRSGRDKFDGGEGIDTYVAGFNATVDWRLEIDLKSGYATIEGDYDHALMDDLINFENVTLNLPNSRAVLRGDNNDNVLIAGGQDDELHGQGGDDILQGGDGADVFVFDLDDTGSDVITDFILTDGDRLDLSGFGYTDKQDVLAKMTDLEGIRLVERNDTIYYEGETGVILSLTEDCSILITSLSVADFASADGWLA